MTTMARSGGASSSGEGGGRPGTQRPGRIGARPVDEEDLADISSDEGDDEVVVAPSSP